MPNIPFKSFARGEITTALYARSDLVDYALGLRTCRNAWISKEGGASNRPGLKFIDETRHPSREVRLIPFIFSTSTGDTYVLEFGHLYIEFIRDGGRIVETAVNITDITEADPGVVTTSASHGYANGDDVYIEGVVGMTQVNGRRFRVANKTATTFELTDTSDNDVDTSGYTAYSSGGTTERVYKVTTTYDESDLQDIRFSQVFDTLILSHPDYDPSQLVRSGHASWAFSDTEDGWELGVASPTGLSGSAGAAGSNTYRYIVTAVGDPANGVLHQESLPGRAAALTITGITQANPPVVTTSGSHNLQTGDEVKLSVVGMDNGEVGLNQRRFTITVASSTTFELLGVDTSSYSAFSSGTCNPTFVRISSAALPTTAAPNTISWTVSATRYYYNVYREKDGVFGFIGFSHGGSFSDTGLVPGTSDPPPRNQVVFQDLDTLPIAVTHYQERRFYGGSDAEPDSVYASSQDEIYGNFSVHTPLTDKDAVTFTLGGTQVNKVMHIVPLRRLIVLTGAGEWVIEGDQNGSITPSTINARQYSYNGSSHVTPAVVDNTVLYVTARGNGIRDLRYDYANDSYGGNDLSLRSSHLFRGHSIRDLAVQRVPDSLVWAIRDDGVALSLTYVPEEQVRAWARHDTDGTFEQVCVIPEGDTDDVGGIDAVYFVVKRTINGVTKRYIERLENRFVKNERQDEMAFVDSFLTYDGRNTAATTMTLTTATTYVAGQSMTLTASAATFASGDVSTNQYWLYTGAGQTGTRVRLTVTAFTDSTHVTVTGNINVPAALQATATTSWSKAVKTVTGLWHLEGESISACGDGFVLANPNDSTLTAKTVSSGSVTFGTAHAVIHAGLPYLSDLETLDLDTAEGSTLSGKAKKVTHAGIYAEKSRKCYIGGAPPTSDTSDPDENLVIFLINETAESDPDTLPDLTTKFMDTPMLNNWNTTGRVFIRMLDPLPLTVLSIVPTVQTR